MSNGKQNPPDDLDFDFDVDGPPASGAPKMRTASPPPMPRRALPPTCSPSSAMCRNGWRGRNW